MMKAELQAIKDRNIFKKGGKPAEPGPPVVPPTNGNLYLWVKAPARVRVLQSGMNKVSPVALAATAVRGCMSIHREKE